MLASPVVARPAGRPALLYWIGSVALGAGLLCHVLAARAIGGSYVAYRDHLIGFFGLTAVSGMVLALLGWRVWRGRHDLTLLGLGLLQVLIGIFVYMERFSVHG